MATNPKIEIFQIRIAKQNDSPVTFDDLFHDLLGSTEYEKNKNILFLDFFAHFIHKIDTGEFITDEKDKKVMTAYDTSVSSESAGSTINAAKEREIISGTIQGGNYGSRRTLSELKNKKKREELDNDRVILDQFYFLLHTPMDDNLGVLILQSYTSENIKKLFQSFLKKLFAPNNEYKKPAFTTFMPKHFREEFKNKSELTKFTYYTRALSNQLSDTAIMEGPEGYSITISVTPTKKPKKSDSTDIVKKLNALFFGNLALGKFKHKKAVLKDPVKGNEAGFEIENDFTLTPTIYLEDRVPIDSGNIPDFTALDKYCKKLLKDHVIPVLYPKM